MNVGNVGDISNDKICISLIINTHFKENEWKYFL